MNRVFVNEHNYVESKSDLLVLESGACCRIKIYILSAGHEYWINQWISGEKIYDNKNEDCRDRMMRYLNYSKLI
ncbi:MAG: hypothetical protein K0S04_4079 [Herbinix sp.]|jgi:hypothetical protein|nr:hypothetical protein [Herbinix sp.]